MTNEFAKIEELREKAGITPFAMCMTAGTAHSTYWRVKNGVAPRGGTLKKWRRAIELGARVHQPGGINLPAVAYRGCVALLAAEFGVDAAAVLASAPRRRATHSAPWLRAANIRAIAVFCVVREFDLPAARVAAAIGVTRAAASAILKRVEDMRADPKTDELVERVGRMISGREE